MSRVFFDTNVVLYAIDLREATKQRVAESLLLRHRRSETAVLSTQVLQEAYRNGVQKLHLPVDFVTDYVSQLAALHVVGSSARFVLDAIKLSQRVQISIWDALIVAAAAEAGCETLVTEDLNHGQVIAGVRVVDPFRDVQFVETAERP